MVSDSIEKGMHEVEFVEVSDYALADTEKVARAQQELDHRMTKWEAVKAYPQACMYLFILAWALINVGYDYSGSALVLSIPAFREDFGYSYVSDGVTEYALKSSWQSAITGGAAIASVVSSFLAPIVADIIGRKWLVLTCCAATLAFTGMQFAATTIEVFFVGKFLNAILLGAIQIVGISYVAELTPPALRGVSTTAINFFFSLAPLVTTIIAHFTSARTDRWSYRALLASQWGFAATASVFLLVLPESPYHHVMKGNDDKALKCLKKIYKDGSAESQLAVIRATIEEANILSDSGSWLELCDKKNLKRTLIAISPMLAMPFSGLAYVNTYLTYYYEVAGFATSLTFKLGCGAQGLSLCGVLLSAYLVDRLGRRFILLYGFLSLAIVNLLIAALGLDTSKTNLVKVSCGFMTLYNFFFNSGIGSVSYVITAELPTSRLRAKTVAIAIASTGIINCAWSFVLPYMFNQTEANMGSSINFIYCGCCFVLTVVFFFILPEASGRSYEEIDEMFVAKVPLRKWPAYTSAVSVEGQKVVMEQSKPCVEYVEDKEKATSLPSNGLIY